MANARRRVRYERRRPERTVLYRLVQEHIATVFAEAEAEGSFGYPSHIKREFERYLSCGILAAGFARIQCSSKGCTFERLVAYSCKGRSICSSCVARRMADGAAHLVDRVLPRAPYRQWTLSLPYRVRYRIGADSALLSKVLSVFLRTLFAWQRRRARRAGLKKPLTGAVTLCQRYGSLLQFSPHFHSWLPDGVFVQNDDGSVTFARLEPPSDDDVEQLLIRIARRVEALVTKTQPVGDDDDNADPLAVDRASAILPALGRAAKSPTQSRPRSRRCSFLDGYSLHADLDVEADERRKLERLLRYGLRPAFAQRRLSITPSNKMHLELRKPTHTNQTAIVLDAKAFLRRLIATIPPRRANNVRFHGVYAPNAKVRPALTALLPKLPLAETDKDDCAHGEEEARHGDAATTKGEPVPHKYRRTWHEFLRRVFDIN